MENRLESVEVAGDVVSEKVNLSVEHAATWHNPRRSLDPSRFKIPARYDPNFKTYPELVKDFFRNAFDRLKRRGRP